MMKCKRFWKTKEYDSVHGTYFVNATEHFNEWMTPEIKIFQVEVLGDSNGCCQEIIVFYERKEISPIGG